MFDYSNYKCEYLSKSQIKVKVENFRNEHWPEKIVPVDMELLLSKRMKIDIIPSRGIKELTKTDAFLKSDLTAIVVDLMQYMDEQDRYANRLRFSFAHEIGHILFDELGLGTYVKNIEYRTFNPQGSRRLRGKIVEHLCDCAAAELLMPESIFKKYLSGFAVSIYSVERLANSFQVSIQAAAIRIAEVSTEPCLVTKWQPEKRKPTNLRLAWCMGPEKKGKGYYEPIHVSVRPPSAIHNAYEGGSCVKSFRLFKIGDGVQRLLTESKGFGQGETRYVISLAFLDR